MQHLTWEDIRKMRDYLLSNCDWTQLNDVNFEESKRTEWQNYRQSLRDITGKFRSPMDVVWPNVPV